MGNTQIIKMYRIEEDTDMKKIIFNLLSMH